MKKSFYNVKSSAGQADIYIFGMIGSGYYYDFASSASQFIADFKALEDKYDRINIHINSPGGDVHEGLPISNTIRASKKDTHTYNEGICYSMGAILLESGKTRHSASNAMLMFHNASTGIFGNSQELRKRADDLDKYDTALAQTLSDQLGLTNKEVQEKFFNFKDNYYTAQEALDNNLIDVIEDYKSSNLPENLKNFTVKKAMAFFSEIEKNEETNFIERVATNVKLKIASFIKSQATPESNNMNFKKSIENLSKENITSVDKAEILSEINNFTNEKEKFSKDEVASKIESALSESKTKTAAAELALTKEQENTAKLSLEIEALKKLVPESLIPVTTTGDKPVKDREEEILLCDIDKEKASMKGI